MVLAYWSLIPLNGTATGMLGRYLFPGILQQGLLYEIAGWEVYAGELIAGLLILVIMAYANIRGVKMVSWIQNIIVVMLVGWEGGADIFLDCYAIRPWLCLYSSLEFLLHNSALQII